MSNSIFLLNNDYKCDIPNNTKHIIISHDYNKILNNIPDTVIELTIYSNFKELYNNIPIKIKIININLLHLRNYNIYLHNLPISLEQIKLCDFSKYCEFDYLDKNIQLYSIEQRKRCNMLKIIKKYIIKLPFNCIITNNLNEKIIDLL